jgi:5-methylcytosine-specific restriction endonuclease McrA
MGTNNKRKRNLFKENHTPSAIERRHRYRKSIKGKLSEKRYLYSKKGKLSVSIRCKIYRKTHPEKVAHYKRIRRERLKHILKTLTFKEWELILKLFDYRCVYCNKTGKLTLDHVIPISRGGEHTKYNVVPACKSCNSKKHNKMPKEWLGEISRGQNRC